MGGEAYVAGAAGASMLLIAGLAASAVYFEHWRLYALSSIGIAITTSCVVVLGIALTEGFAEVSYERLVGAALVSTVVVLPVTLMTVLVALGVFSWRRRERPAQEPRAARNER